MCERCGIVGKIGARGGRGSSFVKRIVLDMDSGGVTYSNT